MRRTFPFSGFSYDETTNKFHAKRMVNRTSFAVCGIFVQSSNDLQDTLQLSYELTPFQVRDCVEVNILIWRREIYSHDV
jgi:hypothetical protein